jgi:antitoxin VapB
MSKAVAKSTPVRAQRAKLFRTGGSQAVRLPKDCRLPGSEALVRRVGQSIVLSPMPTEYTDEFRELLLGPKRSLVARPRQRHVEQRDDIDP